MEDEEFVGLGVEMEDGEFVGLGVEMEMEDEESQGFWHSKLASITVNVKIGSQDQGKQENEFHDYLS
ncbi:hypothetical protein F0562_012390 [Nyssa sinensis]|uniref:Uncharacterized protein n=1 Tax=Nyssa sinensis TaxID=561372 RepID=A0A5J4ZXE5_9ASTE|nr:hypothetical protein F0562_012390 [Nyssa sinensis]